MCHYSYGLRKVAINNCTCVYKCLSLSILSIIQLFSSCVYCAYCLFIYVKFSCCPLRALNWSKTELNGIELNYGAENISTLFLNMS